MLCLTSLWLFGFSSFARIHGSQALLRFLLLSIISAQLISIAYYCSMSIVLMKNDMFECCILTSLQLFGFSSWLQICNQLASQYWLVAIYNRRAIKFRILLINANEDIIPVQETILYCQLHCVHTWECSNYFLSSLISSDYLN